MLKEITISNFRSINNEITFTMEADSKRVTEFTNHIINLCDNDILKVSSMYGPNGGGKSNIIFALQLPKILVFNNNQYSLGEPRTSICEFSDSDIISETLFFVTNDYEIGYKFDFIPKVIKQNTIAMNFNPGVINSFIVKNEMVSYRRKSEDEFYLLLERNDNGKIESEELTELGINLKQPLAENMSAITYLFNTYANREGLDDNGLNVIKSLASEIAGINLLEIDGPINLNIVEKVISNNKERLLKLLNDVDIKISDIVIKTKDKNKTILFERELVIDGKAVKKYLKLSDESFGTQKIFWIFLNILATNSTDKTNIFLADDMNAYLHPKLYRAIIELFNSDSNKNSQLIFNSHDILNMTNDLFRRDEIWFVYRDDNYSTCVVPLSNIVNYKGEQIRKDAKYYKQYLEGKYGADPFIARGLSWNE